MVAKKRATQHSLPPLDEPSIVGPEVLVLDPENPRLVLSTGAKPSEKTIIKQLYREDELGELIKSMAANGYLDFEPMIVMGQKAGGPFTVLEGNRRLAAVRVLTTPALAKELSIPLPEMRSELVPTFKKLRVIRVRDRAAARPFIGFKHINGPHRWDSYAKAKFAAKWFREERKLDPEASLDSIAERIGDNHDTIKRMVAAVYVLDQADDAGLFRVEDRADRRFNFSHLYTALSRREYMDYLGIEGKWSQWIPSVNPIDQAHQDRLRDVLRWIYGSKEDGVSPIIRSQNPDLKRLGAVLTNHAALAVLQTELDLDSAHEQTISGTQRFQEALVAARKEVRSAVNNLSAYEGQDSSLLEIAKDISESAETLKDRMQKKLDKAQADSIG